MKDFTDIYPNRGVDIMHYADTDTFTVRRVQAFKCPPNDDSTRWVPEFSCSTTSVFSSEGEARMKLIQEAKKESQKLNKRLAVIADFMGKHTVSR